MTMLNTTDDLAAFCKDAAGYPYVTVDTEFMRRRTYYAKLCLIQLAYPAQHKKSAVLVDPLADDLSFEPLYDLFRNAAVTKVFHSARQDLEILYRESEFFPKPIFDTQLASMVCGLGHQVSYHALIKKVTSKTIDKSSQTTDWAKRPLSKSQKQYALSDVTYLRDAYEYLIAELDRTNRAHWVQEEVENLTDPRTYMIDIDSLWQRIRVRSESPLIFSVLRELVKFREMHAQHRNIPRTWVCKDEVLAQIALSQPTSRLRLGQLHSIGNTADESALAEGILKAVDHGLKVPRSKMPIARRPTDREALAKSPLAALLGVLLKVKAGEAQVASALIATSADLDALAVGKRNLSLLSGWRYEVYGRDALRLCNGEVALIANGESVALIQT
ncbi:MAG: ribonuclease D [Aestuariivita sp.]|nr:ribonuclease D [Aestuariivita sp.]